MVKIINKFKSNRGSTLLYAVLLLLVCAILASTLLTVSLAGTKRYNREIEERQKYYSVYSAARMITDGLGSVYYKKEVFELLPGGECGSTEGHEIPENLPGELSITGGVESINAVFLQDLTDIINGLTGDAVTGVSTTRDYAVSAEGMDNLTIIMDVDEDYNLTFSMSCGKNSIVIKYEATVAKNEDTVSLQHTYFAEDTTEEDTGNGEEDGGTEENSGTDGEELDSGNAVPEAKEPVEKICDYSYLKKTTEITWGSAAWSEE